MAATRNASLNRLVPRHVGHGSAHENKTLKMTKLRFGKLNDRVAWIDGSRSTRVGFGLSDEVVPLGKKRWWH